ncbi:MAG: VOC family protein [Nitriliruptorales bacterium]|nr:VOC family protein [Nitriliruptorales bacterium]
MTPSLVVTPCAEAIDWYVEVFGAQEVGDRMVGPDGSVGHAEVRIGDSVVMLADEWPDFPVRSPRTLGGTTTGLFIYTDDVEELWQRAVDAGAVVGAPLGLQFYGDLAGRIEDPFGHSWGLGQHVEDVDDDETARRAADLYAGMGE